MSYTIKELESMMTTLDDASDLNGFITLSQLNEQKFMELLKGLLETKIETELKERRKRVKKLINECFENSEPICKIAEMLDYLESPQSIIDIKAIFSTKKSTLNQELAEYYQRDYYEFFSMFARDTALTEVLQTLK